MMKRSHESIVDDTTTEQSILDNDNDGNNNNLNPNERTNKKKKFISKGNNNKGSKKENKFNDSTYDNDLYYSYYKEQLKEVVKDDEEWKKIKEAWLMPLPVTFRINLSSNKIMKNLHNRIVSLSNELRELKLKNDHGNDINFQSIPWYPDQNAWFLPVSSRVLKKKEIPIYEAIHNFLVENNSQGYITRQEAVSMIPCLLLDVQSHHTILDMCAAPGSKTSQILEMMHLQAQQKSGDNFYNNLSGAILANDIKPQRCNTLITQTKRLNSPCIIVTYHEAQIFPSLYHPIKKRPILYDRILCDVPCSGDGTLRKHPDIWNRWKPSMGAGIHSLQLQILSRAIKLLKPNGRIVYSTCSLNPVEDEAVVAHALSQNPDLHLVDVSGELSGLIRSNGINTWKFMDNDGNWYSSHDELPEKLKRLPKTLFPPENASSLNLERCIRILPHHQDSGGFFVAVLERKPENQKESTEVDDDDDNTVYQKKEREKPVPGGAFAVPKSDEFVQAWNSIEKFFDFDSFPKDQILTRSDNASKLYFVSKSCKYIFDYDIVNKLKIKHMGVRLFEKTCSPDEVKCNYRICQEGVEIIASYCRSRLLDVSKNDMLTLLQEKEVLFTKLDIEQTLNEIDEGPCIFRTSLENSAVLVSGWRGKAKVRIFLKDIETSYFINQLN